MIFTAAMVMWSPANTRNALAYYKGRALRLSCRATLEDLCRWMHNEA